MQVVQLSGPRVPRPGRAVHRGRGAAQPDPRPRRHREGQPSRAAPSSSRSPRTGRRPARHPDAVQPGARVRERRGAGPPRRRARRARASSAPFRSTASPSTGRACTWRSGAAFPAGDLRRGHDRAAAAPSGGRAQRRCGSATTPRLVAPSKWRRSARPRSTRQNRRSPRARARTPGNGIALWETDAEVVSLAAFGSPTPSGIGSADLHPARAPRPRVCQRADRARVHAATGRRAPLLLPVHGPRGADLEQDLRRDRPPPRLRRDPAYAFVWAGCCRACASA